MSLSPLSYASRPSQGADALALEIIQTPWTIEGDPDEVWRWGAPDREGALRTWRAPDRKSPVTTRTRIHSSGFDPAAASK